MLFSPVAEFHRFDDAETQTCLSERQEAVLPGNTRARFLNQSPHLKPKPAQENLEVELIDDHQ